MFFPLSLSLRLLHIYVICPTLRDVLSRNTDNIIFIYITGRFIMFSVVTNIYNKKSKGPALMELFTAIGKLKKFFFLTTRDIRCVHHW